MRVCRVDGSNLVDEAEDQPVNFVNLNCIGELRQSQVSPGIRVSQMVGVYLNGCAIVRDLLSLYFFTPLTSPGI
jgi:hypothetical protein